MNEVDNLHYKVFGKSAFNNYRNGSHYDQTSEKFGIVPIAPAVAEAVGIQRGSTRVFLHSYVFFECLMILSNPAFPVLPVSSTYGVLPPPPESRPLVRTHPWLLQLLPFALVSTPHLTSSSQNLFAPALTLAQFAPRPSAASSTSSSSVCGATRPRTSQGTRAQSIT